jgi:galactokinase
MRPFDVKILSEMKRQETAQHFEPIFGTALMRDSYRSLRELYEVSCRELDIMVSG